MNGTQDWLSNRSIEQESPHTLGYRNTSTGCFRIHCSMKRKKQFINYLLNGITCVHIVANVNIILS